MKYTIVLSLLLISTVLTTACTSDLDRNTDGPPDNRDSGSDAQVEPDTGPHDADLADLEDQGDMASIDLGESGDSPPDMVPLDMESGVCARAVARVAHDLSALSDITLEYGRPLKLLHHESSSPAAPITEHSWKVVTQPVDSPRALQDGFLTPTIAGVYVAELTVRDEAGNSNCNDYDTRFVTVRVTDSPEFIAEISWSGDAEQGPDFDLHYKHPNGQWNNAPWDIYWRNRTSDWGVSGGGRRPTPDARHEHLGLRTRHSPQSRVDCLRFRCLRLRLQNAPFVSPSLDLDSRPARARPTRKRSRARSILAHR